MNDELPPGWASATLGQVCEKPQYGWTTKSVPGPGLPYLRTTDISGGEVDWTSVPSATEVPGDPARFLLNHDDIVVSRAGSVGISHLIRNPPAAIFASYLIRLRVGDFVMPEYVALYLKSPAYWRAISETQVGIAIPNVNAKRLAAIGLPIAPLAEQERIVVAIEEHFSRLDFAEAALDVAGAKLQALRRSVLAAAFAGRLTNPSPTTETDPGQLPEGWRWMALHDLLEHTIGGAWGKPIDEDEVNVRVLRVTEFGKHTVLEPETGVVRAVSAKQLASRQLQLGDILLEKSGGGPNQPVGRVVAFRTHLAEPAVPTNFVQLLRPSRDVVDPAFLTWTLDWWHKNGTAEAHQRATTNIRNLQTKAYLAQPVAVPPRAEQEQVVATIEEHFSVLDAAETALDAVREKISAFRRSVLAEAFAGRLVPQDSDDEPAAALLARIAAERPIRPASRKRSA